MRSLLQTDIATGLIPVWDNYSSSGPSDTWHIKNKVPERPKPVCYILQPESCPEEIYATVKNGTAVVKNYIVLEDENAAEWLGEGDEYVQSIFAEEL